MSERLANLLKEAGVVKSGDFTFYSGFKSKQKIVLDDALCDWEILDLITDMMQGYAEDAEVIVGQISNGNIIAQELARRTEKEFRVYNKKEDKLYGKSIKGKTCLAVDDVRSTGLSLVKQVKAIREAGGICERAVTVADWNIPQPSGLKPEELMRRVDVLYYSLIPKEMLL